MGRTVRSFLTLEIIVFGLAALLHAGVLTTGYEHREARIAETVIGLVLLAGLVVSLAAPHFTRRSGLMAQGFALLGTLVGVFVIAIGVGPRTLLDIAIHGVMLALLISGLVAATRLRAGAVGV